MSERAGRHRQWCREKGLAWWTDRRACAGDSVAEIEAALVKALNAAASTDDSLSESGQLRIYDGSEWADNVHVEPPADGDILPLHSVSNAG